MGTLRFVTWNMLEPEVEDKRLNIFKRNKQNKKTTGRPVTAADEFKTLVFPNVFSACYIFRGIVILIHKSVNFTVLNRVIDPERKFLIMKLSIQRYVL